MSRKPKGPSTAAEGQVRTTVSMTQKFWDDEVEKLMKEEGFNNFSSYMAFLVKLRRENLHQRRLEVARLETETSVDPALNDKATPDPKRKAV